MEMDAQLAKEARTGAGAGKPQAEREDTKTAPRSRARAKRPMNREEFTYHLHLMMLWAAGGLVGLGSLGHFFQPADKLWEWMVISGAGVLLGKFSNRIGQPTLPPKPEPGEESDAG